MLFREHPLILERYRKQYKHILVDEFQDLSPAQYDILRMLSVGSGLARIPEPDDGAPFDSPLPSYTAKEQLSSLSLGSKIRPIASPFLDELYGRSTLASIAFDRNEISPKGNVVNVFCAGDDDQSIYSWRGAQIELMRKFRFDFPDAKILRYLRIYTSFKYR